MCVFVHLCARVCVHVCVCMCMCACLCTPLVCITIIIEEEVVNLRSRGETREELDREKEWK